jgi:hypothetical protein
MEYTFLHLALGRYNNALYVVLGVYGVLATIAVLSVCIAAVMRNARSSKLGVLIMTLVAATSFVRIAGVLLPLFAADKWGVPAAPAFLPLLALIFMWLTSASATHLWGTFIPGPIYFLSAGIASISLHFCDVRSEQE